MEKTLEQKIHDILFSRQFEEFHKEFHKKFVENAEDPNSEETFQEIRKVFETILPETILPRNPKSQARRQGSGYWL